MTDYNYATIEDYLALPEDATFEKVVDSKTFQPLAIHEGKAYTYETMQDLKALGKERFMKYQLILKELSENKITEEQAAQLLKEI